MQGNTPLHEICQRRDEREVVKLLTMALQRTDAAKVPFWVQCALPYPPRPAPPLC